MAEQLITTRHLQLTVGLVLSGAIVLTLMGQPLWCDCSSVVPWSWYLPAVPQANSFAA